MNTSLYKEEVSFTPSNTYRKEIGEALTEFLFGEEGNLDPIKLKDPRVQYYVLKRKTPRGGDSIADFDAERRLFSSFWPPSQYSQVLNLIGSQGVGKSTFTRYFFQYFLPNYVTLIHNMDAASDLSRIHVRAVRRHILLYADLRHAPQTDFRRYVFCKLGEGLHHVAQRLGFANDFGGELDYVEDRVKHNISKLARETEGAQRKWYISWIFDNSDQLAESQQLELTNIVLDQIPQEQPRIFSTDPVQEGERRELWRVIIPIRPETWRNLEPTWQPLPNRYSLYLEPINHDILLKKRADFIFETVRQSKKHYQPDPKRITADRADWDLRTPNEMAKTLQEDMLASGFQLHNTGLATRNALDLLDALVGDSARRRLTLIPRVAFSRPFEARKALGIKEGWGAPMISTFYFFDGLICGHRRAYDPRESPILNLYGLGATHTSRTCHSIFVGLHTIYLLAQGKQWTDVKTDLKTIGYPDNDLVECERWLLNKELIKKLWQGGYQIESSIVKGYWELLKERAYTDNMAVACARSWGVDKQAPETDSLDPEQLLHRFRGSIWFMKNNWKAEKHLAVYSPDASPQLDNIGNFNNFRKKLMLPAVTHYVAKEYLERIQNVRTYQTVERVITSDKEQWQKNLQELEALVKESGGKGISLRI